MRPFKPFVLAVSSITGKAVALGVVDRVLTAVRGFFQCPDVCGFGVAEYVCVAIVCTNTKVQGIDSVPLFFNGLDKEQPFADPKLDRTLIRFMAGIRFDLDFHSDCLGTAKTGIEPAFRKRSCRFCFGRFGLRFFGDFRS